MDILKAPFPITGHKEPTELYQDMFGTEVHTTIIANLFKRSWIRNMPMNIAFNLFIAMAFTIVISALNGNVVKGFSIVFLLIGTWHIVSYIAFVKFHYFIPGCHLFCVLGIKFMAILLASLFFERYLHFKVFGNVTVHEGKKVFLSPFSCLASM